MRLQDDGDGKPGYDLICTHVDNFKAMTNLNEEEILTNSSILNNLSITVPLLVPESSAFQHFIDGVLPKLVQISPLLTQNNVNFVLYKPRDSIIYDILHKLGIARSRIIFLEGGVFSANTNVQLNTCITPPTHPVHMKIARELLGVKENCAISKRNHCVILLTR